MLTGSCTPRVVCRVACGALAMFGQDVTALGDILVRIAIDGEMLAPAVLHALLAFSLLHHYGLQAQAVELKIAALGSLAEGVIASELCAKKAIQHIATGMLLCSFEIHHLSCTSVQWWRYLSGVNTIISSYSTHKLLEFCPDVVALLDWVHYHNVLARFSLLHWKREGAPDLASIPQDIFLRSACFLHVETTVRNMRYDIQQRSHARSQRRRGWLQELPRGIGLEN
jgi:hypothetical protein